MRADGDPVGDFRQWVVESEIVVHGSRYGNHELQQRAPTRWIRAGVAGWSASQDLQEMNEVP